MRRNMGILLPFRSNSNNFELDIGLINHIEGDFAEKKDSIAEKNVPLRKVPGICLRNKQE